jgi:hypothetical protein
MSTTGVTSGTGEGLLEFLGWATKKGNLNPNTAAALRAASRELLGVEADDGNFAGVEIRSLDVDDLGRRFANLRAAAYTPASPETYQSRFRRAVEMYKKFLENPASWRPDARERGSQAPEATTGRRLLEVRASQGPLGAGAARGERIKLHRVPVSHSEGCRRVAVAAGRHDGWRSQALGSVHRNYCHGRAEAPHSGDPSNRTVLTESRDGDIDMSNKRVRSATTGKVREVDDTQKVTETTVSESTKQQARRKRHNQPRI